MPEGARAGLSLREETDLRVGICGYRLDGGQSILLGVDFISLSLRCRFHYLVTELTRIVT